jgi:cell division protein FtsI/penicillin-binding protein 2
MTEVARSQYFYESEITSDSTNERNRMEHAPRSEITDSNKKTIEMNIKNHK